MRRGGGKYCSNECYGESRKGITPTNGKPKVTRVCLQCGETFQAFQCHVMDGRSKYCSKACLIKAKSITWKTERGCVGCGAVFVPTRKDKVFCTHECFTKHNTGPSNPSWTGGNKRTECLACGKEYEYDAGSRGVVCSLRCWGMIKTRVTKVSVYKTGKGGRRADLGGAYFRSRWEANWARYLEWLRKNGQVSKWEFEPETFEFAKIKRGAKFYTPDFRITNVDGSIEYHEIKGYLDPVSKTKLKRMARYHPKVKLKLIDKDAYTSVARSIGRSLAGWEWSSKKSN